LNQTTFLTQAQALLGKAIGEHSTQHNAEVKSIINQDCQMAHKRMPLGPRLAVNTHNMGGRFVESAKNARWSMSPQEAGDGFESIVEFQVQIKRHYQRKYDNADPRYAGKINDPQGGETTMLMQQVSKVMTVNYELEDESSWIWLTSEQIGFPLQSEFAKENHGEAGSWKQCNDQRTVQTAVFFAPINTDFIRNTKKELYDENLEDALEKLDLEWR